MEHTKQDKLKEKESRAFQEAIQAIMVRSQHRVRAVGNDVESLPDAARDALELAEYVKVLRIYNDALVRDYNDLLDTFRVMLAKRPQNYR